MFCRVDLLEWEEPVVRFPIRDSAVCHAAFVRVQFDCGIHPGYSGMAALPYFDEIDPISIDVLLVTQWVTMNFPTSVCFINSIRPARIGV